MLSSFQKAQLYRESKQSSISKHTKWQHTKATCFIFCLGRETYQWDFHLCSGYEQDSVYYKSPSISPMEFHSLSAITVFLTLVHQLMQRLWILGCICFSCPSHLHAYLSSSEQTLQTKGTHHPFPQPGKRSPSLHCPPAQED